MQDSGRMDGQLLQSGASLKKQSESSHGVRKAHSLESSGGLQQSGGVFQQQQAELYRVVSQESPQGLIKTGTIQSSGSKGGSPLNN